MFWRLPLGVEKGVWGGREGEKSACEKQGRPPHATTRAPPSLATHQNLPPPHLSHPFHLQCIMEWSARSPACPLCYAPLALADRELDSLLPRAPPPTAAPAGRRLHLLLPRLLPAPGPRGGRTGGGAGAAGRPARRWWRQQRGRRAARPLPPRARAHRARLRVRPAALAAGHAVRAVVVPGQRVWRAPAAAAGGAGEVKVVVFPFCPFPRQNMHAFSYLSPLFFVPFSTLF